MKSPPPPELGFRCGYVGSNFCSAIYRRREECREGKMAGGSGGAQAGGDETGAERLLRAVWAKANDAE